MQGFIRPGPGLLTSFKCKTSSPDKAVLDYPHMADAGCHKSIRPPCFERDMLLPQAGSWATATSIPLPATSNNPVNYTLCA